MGFDGGLMLGLTWDLTSGLNPFYAGFDMGFDAFSQELDHYKSELEKMDKKLTEKDIKLVSLSKKARHKLYTLYSSDTNAFSLTTLSI